MLIWANESCGSSVFSQDIAAELEAKPRGKDPRKVVVLVLGLLVAEMGVVQFVGFQSLMGIRHVGIKDLERLRIARSLPGLLFSRTSLAHRVARHAVQAIHHSRDYAFARDGGQRCCSSTAGW